MFLHIGKSVTLMTSSTTPLRRSQLTTCVPRFSTGAIEQAITGHPSIAEACCIGIPDSLKGHLPFAFATLSTADHPASAIPDSQLFAEVQKLVRDQIGAIASLGGMLTYLRYFALSCSGR